MSAKCTSGCGRTGTYFFFFAFFGLHIVNTLSSVSARKLKYPSLARLGSSTARGTYLFYHSRWYILQTSHGGCLVFLNFGRLLGSSSRTLHRRSKITAAKFKTFQVQWNLDLRKLDLRKNLDLRKIVGKVKTL